MPRNTRLPASLEGASTDVSSSAGDQRVLLRFAGESDAAALEWLRQRDTSSLPPPPHLVAEVDGSILAARSLRTGETIADPFRHTAHLCRMLEVRAAHLERRPRPRLALRLVRRYARGEAW
jgi:hypothetical protein